MNEPLGAAAAWLQDIDRHIYGGRRDLAEGSRARLLTIGPGALREALTLADALPNATLCCLDRDPASREGLRAEAERRGISLVDDRGVVGPFDFIEAGAEVSRARDPVARLRDIAALLRDDRPVGGGIGLRVPGAVGLSAIDYMRDAVALLASARDGEPDRLSLLRQLVADLPPTHWLAHGRVAPREAAKWAASQRLFADSPPRLFSVAELLSLAEASELRVSGMAPEAAYDPLRYVRDPRLHERIAQLDPPSRWIVAECVRGGPWTHHAFLVRATRQEVPRPRMPTAAEARVREQYEAYPYPARSPADDQGGLAVGSPSNLAEIDHYVFGGGRDWNRPFRALIAGGGTGDAAIMLARQLAARQTPAELVHLDISGASQAIARARAEALGLSALRFVPGSLLDVAAAAPGPYDYVDCCGVLHHLEDPAAGARALSGTLAADGGMGVMVYGEVGRTGVYHVAEALRLLAPADDAALDAAARVAIAKHLIADLPDSNWLARNPFVRDHADGGDAGVFDLLLHASDRPFRVPALDKLIAGAGLRMTGLVPPVLYRPDLRDPELARRLAARTDIERAALAELLGGSLKKHIGYAVAASNTVAPPAADDPNAIPVWRDNRDAAWIVKLPSGARATLRRDGVRMHLEVPRLTSAFARLIDGRRRVVELIDIVQQGQPKLDSDAVQRLWSEVYRALNAFNLLLLRRAPV